MRTRVDWGHRARTANTPIVSGVGQSVQELSCIIIDRTDKTCPLCNHPIAQPLSTLLANVPDAKFYICGACEGKLMIHEEPTEHMRNNR